MTKKLRALFTILLGMVLSSYSISADIKQTILQQSIDSLREQAGVAGFSMAAVKNGEVIYSINSGFTDQHLRVPVTSNTRFRLASVSKVVGASLIADLIQQGKLSHNDQVGKWFPELPNRFHDITIEQLVNHTSGIPHYQAIDICCWSTQYDHAVDSLQEIQNRELLFKPGTQYKYSSFGYTMLGAIYEKASGKSIYAGMAEFSRKLISANSPIVENVTIREPLRSNLFELTQSNPKSVVFDNKSYTALGGGLSASAKDLALLAGEIANGEHFNNETKNLLFQRNESGIDDGNVMYDLAFGWRVGQDFDGNKVYHHAGTTLGARSFVLVYPEFGLSIAFLSNTSWVSQMETNGFTIAKMILTDEVELENELGNSFLGHFADEPILLERICEQNQCELMETQGTLSTWLNRFNHVVDRKSPKKRQSWPIYHFGNDLILVSSIGLVYINQIQDVLSAQIGASKFLELRERPSAPAFPN